MSNKNCQLDLTDLFQKERIVFEYVDNEEFFTRLEEVTSTCVSVSPDDNCILFTGDNCKAARELFIQAGREICNQDEKISFELCVKVLDRIVSKGFAEDSFLGVVTPRGYIQARSPNQSNYFDVIENNDITFGLGPAGTGKTFLAVAKIISRYKAGLIEKMVITRPPVESGETIGFLPGDERSKLGPYVVPILDCFHEFIGVEETQKLIDEGILEINHVGYFRGRTLKRTGLIVDESQNCTKDQGKMIVTRLGEDSFMVVNGDLEQSDIKGFNALQYFLEVFDVCGQPPEGVGVAWFDESDCRRHPTVANMLGAFKTHKDWQIREQARREQEEQK